eukprot:gb/GECG01013865.1/.p1 GENE.gb/GECG01013865.1/~~gb/GECG01013865.1/.p1  ORF type:complete len:395 (+),score=38.23 gb/GECG01013865.1/:1-1185(+)
MPANATNQEYENEMVESPEQDSRAFSPADLPDREELPPGFEGPEKTIEIDFVPNLGPQEGARKITREQWDYILSQARCTILDVMQAKHFDSYLLSESSLFVYPQKVIIKTCGTTTLLRAVVPLIETAKKLGMQLEWIGYSRKDFTYPDLQQFPHRSMDEEIQFLKGLFPEGAGHVLGPITGDHWLLFVADYCERPSHESTDRTIDIMMYDIDPSVARLFETSEECSDGKTASRLSGIDQLLPGSNIQEWLFEPCGYSMNGVLFGAYWTIHVTPESHCSYASFECNIKTKSYGALINSVLRIFRPRRFTMTLFADEYGLREIEQTPYMNRVCPFKENGDEPAYRLSARSETDFMGDYRCMVGNFYRSQPNEKVAVNPQVPNAEPAASELRRVTTI